MKYLRSAAARTHSPRLPYACLRCARSGPLRAARRTDRGEGAQWNVRQREGGRWRTKGSSRCCTAGSSSPSGTRAVVTCACSQRTYSAAVGVRRGVTHLLHSREDLHAEVARLAEKLALFRHILVPPAKQLGPRALLQSLAVRQGARLCFLRRSALGGVAGARCVWLCARRACAVHGRAGAHTNACM